MPCFASSFLSGWRLALLCARRLSETSATPAATSQCLNSFPTLASSSGKKFYAFATNSQKEGKNPFCGVWPLKRPFLA